MSRNAADRNRSLPAFTLVELLIATAVTSIVLTLLGAVLIQLFQVTAQTTGQMALAGDTALAVQALARDVNGAAMASATSTTLTLSQPDPQGGAARTVVYTLAPPLLLRSENGVEQTLARHVAAASSFSPAGIITGTRLITVRLVSIQGTDSVESRVDLALRPLP